MYYCDPCAKERKWPETMSRSRGKCEVCDQVAVCYDRPSSMLPDPPLPLVEDVTR